MTSAPADAMEKSPKTRLSQQALSLPNLLTYLRVLGIPGVLILMSVDTPRYAFFASLVFALASVTDALDGYIARRYNLGSVLGKFLDPLADKLLVLAVLLMLLDLGRVPVWAALIIIGREMTITGLRSVAAAEGIVIAARDLGKTKTAFQLVGLWALIVNHAYPIELLPEPVDFHRLGLAFLYISLFFSVLSAWDYLAGFFRATRS
ncbi:MAG: CDP-diacylglycerol--glycerol-3-phosphate 3-phosphatidyltransferase [Myxococcota bacterium]